MSDNDERIERVCRAFCHAVGRNPDGTYTDGRIDPETRHFLKVPKLAVIRKGSSKIHLCIRRRAESHQGRLP
jgi:hypothetical protein